MPPPDSNEAALEEDFIPAPTFAQGLTRPVHCSTLPQAPSRRQYWKKRRFWAAVIMLLTGVTGISIAVHRGHQTRIIFINTGGETLPVLSVTAAGFTHRVPVLESEASYRWVLPEEGGHAAPITIQSNPAEGSGWRWEGEPVQAGTGTRLMLHLHADGMVEPGTSQSVWKEISGF